MTVTSRRRGPALRFQVFDTPVRIGLGFPLTIVAVPALLFWDRLSHQPWLVGWWFLLVTVSVLVHEGGHVAALRAYGFHPEVSLNALGGLTSTDETGHLSHRRSIIVSLAGPLTGIALGITIEMALLPIDHPTVNWIRSTSWFVNIGWSLVNLLPIMPLDGGHVMREVVDMVSRRRGVSILWLVSGVATLAALAWWQLGDRYPVLVTAAIVLTVVTCLRFFAFTGRQKLVQEVEIARERLAEGALDDGITTLLPLATGIDHEVVGEGAYTTLGWALLHQRRFDDLARLDPTRFHPVHRPLLVAAVAWFRGDLGGAMGLIGESLANGRLEPPVTYFDRVFGRIGELDRLVQHVATMTPIDASNRAATRLRNHLVAAGVNRPASVFSAA